MSALTRHALCLLTTGALAGLAGCATTDTRLAPPARHVAINARGEIMYLGAPLSAAQLVKRLKAEGAQPKQEIRVHLDDLRNKRLMVDISQALVQAGFTRVLFMDERKAVSTVVGEPPSPDAGGPGFTRDVEPAPAPASP